MMKAETLSPDLLCKMDAYWRAANYLTVGQLYLYENPLLRETLTLAHIKPLVVGHWGTVPGQNFIYVHLNRAIQKYDLNMFYVSGPGHGGAALVVNVYLEGTWGEVYPGVTQDTSGMQKLFKQFSFPGAQDLRRLGSGRRQLSWPSPAKATVANDGSQRTAGRGWWREGGKHPRDLKCGGGYLRGRQRHLQCTALSACHRVDAQ